MHFGRRDHVTTKQRSKSSGDSVQKETKKKKSPQFNVAPIVCTWQSNEGAKLLTLRPKAGLLREVSKYLPFKKEERVDLPSNILYCYVIVLRPSTSDVMLSSTAGARWSTCLFCVIRLCVLDGTLLFGHIPPVTEQDPQASRKLPHANPPLHEIRPLSIPIGSPVAYIIT
ncbi:hypothetical protein BX600DRAFT_175321 [Xylariales sp. PMI_506]|nr:hypothetical protein BX600DRAFT_175321 [Xylariales sp. PMI_506]